MPKFPRRIAIDTGAIVALILRGDPSHQACRDALSAIPELASWFTTESCLTEVSWLLPNDKLHRRKILDLIQALRIQLVVLDQPALHRVFELQNKYNDLPMDFADASLVVACECLDVRHVFTLDRRDFSVYRPKHTKLFQLLPN